MADYLDYIIDNCSIEELKQGYYLDKHSDIYICLCCGEVFSCDEVYMINSKTLTAKGIMKNHIRNEHGSAFDFLLNLDKRYNGLSSRQKEIFRNFYKHKDTASRVEKLNISPSTVRIYKFKNTEKMRQSKVYLALYDLIENSQDNFDSEEFLKIINDTSPVDNSSDSIIKTPLLHNKRLTGK